MTLMPATASNGITAGAGTRSTSPRPATPPGPDRQDATDPGTGPARAQGRGEPPNLVTNVVTTGATVPDSAMTTPVRQDLAGKDLLPAEHLADSGYPSAELIIHAARVFGMTLVSPLLLDTSAQARAGAGYEMDALSIDWDAGWGTV